MLDLNIVTEDGKIVAVSQDTVVNLFHKIYYNSLVWQNTHWFGNQILKCPLDLWIYQELIYQLKPDVLIECGTFRGGSSLFFANMFDIIGKGHIVSIDITARESLPQHPRITYVSGSSTDPEVAKAINIAIGSDKCVLVVLDSDHSQDHVLSELRTYASFVSPGSYLIVEDSNINGHPVRSDFGPGPMEAIDIFLKENGEFNVDLSREKFFLTLNPRGYLKKKA